MNPKISIHVDGYYGLVQGIPNLLNLFDKYNIKATFYINMGFESFIFDYIKYKRRNKNIDNNTKNTVSRYSKIQLLSMVLLHRGLGHSHPKLLREIKKRGHEVEIHCWNHLEWSSNFEKFNYKKQIEKCVESYEEIFGYKPKKFVAPTWKINNNIIKQLKEQGIGTIQILDKDKLKFKNEKINLDILTYSKTVDELLGEGNSREQILEIYKKELNRKNANVYFHADYEGRNGIKLLEEILKWRK